MAGTPSPASRASRIGIALACGAGLLVGVALGALLRGGDDAPAPGGSGPGGQVSAAPPTGSPDLAGSLAALRAQLDEEREARLELAREVAALRGQIEVLTFGESVATSETGAERTPLAGLTRSDGSSEDAPRSGAAGRETARGEEEPEEARWFDEEALVDAGLDPEEAERLRERFEAHELSLLFLRDRAIREGWIRRPRYRRERDKLEGTLRNEASDDDYDAMLYAAGRNNRVVLRSVLGNSPAHQAGLRAGDAVLSYGGVRIFEPRALRNATTSGRAGDQTEMRVQRGDEDLRIYLPRGPIGAALEPDRRSPDRYR